MVWLMALAQNWKKKLPIRSVLFSSNGQDWSCTGIGSQVEKDGLPKLEFLLLFDLIHYKSNKLQSSVNTMHSHSHCRQSRMSYQQLLAESLPLASKKRGEVAGFRASPGLVSSFFCLARLAKYSALMSHSINASAQNTIFILFKRSNCVGYPMNVCYQCRCA